MDELLPDHPRAHILSGMALLRWSPRIWGALHGLSFLYPAADLTPLLLVLSKTMPCAACASHVAQYLEHHPIRQDGPYRWFHYLVDLHNDVNLRTAKPIHPIHEALPTYHRVFNQHPEHFRTSVHHRFWQTLWWILASSDFSPTNRANLDEIRHLFAIAKDLMQVPDEDLPDLHTYDPDTSWVVQWHQNLVDTWSTNPTRIPRPLQWWVDRVSSYRQIHIHTHRHIQHIHTDPDLALLTLAFVEDSMGNRWVRRVIPGPWDRQTWAYLESMETLRLAFFRHPAPVPVTDIVPTSANTGLWIGGVVGALVILTISVGLMIRYRRTTDTTGS